MTEPETVRTKDRILNAAERLFATQGYAETSLRTIVSEAVVNLAAVHYHFHSKEALFEAVVARRSDPINRERLAMLDQCESFAGREAPPLEKIVEAFFMPAFRVKQMPGGEIFVRLMARIHADGEASQAVFKKHFGEVVRRFTQAFRHALPGLPPEELFWRMHFAIGAMAHTLKDCQSLHLLAGGMCGAPDPETTARRLMQFVIAGFRAPLSEN